MIFIDTGAFVARFVARDQYHQQAITLWQHLREPRTPCLTSNFVLDETLTLLARRTTYAFAAERARNLLASQWLVVLRPDQDDELAGVDWFVKYSDQRVSFTDCISFALMTRYEMKTAFAFDHHFRIAGFEMLVR